MAITTARFMVMGLAGAGTTTFIDSMAQGGSKPDYAEIIARATLKIELYGASQTNWRTIIEEVLGVIMVVDSTQPEKFPQVIDILTAVLDRTMPCIVAYNRHDQDGAAPSQVFRDQMPKGTDIKVFACNAVTPASVESVLLALIYQMLSSDLDV